MKNRISKILVSLVALALSSCQHEEDVENLSPSVNEKWLSFNSSQDLKTFIENGKESELEVFQRDVVQLNNNEFKPLMRPVKFEEDKSDRKYAEKRLADYEKLLSTYEPGFSISRSTADAFDISVDEDPIIADPYFASVLNEDREILVNDTVYKFTEKGLFYTPVSNYNTLSTTISRIDPCIMLSMEGSADMGNQVTAFMPMPIEGGCGGGGGSCCSGGGGSSGGGTYIPPTKEEVRDNLKVCEYRENVLNKLFGPSEKCIDKFSDSKRIKVKTWAQNYLIFASTGVKVKSQERTLGIWWADKIDELELGYSIASFKYSGLNSFPSNTFSTTDFQYELNGYTVNQYGQYVSGPSPARNLFDNFPLPNDTELIKIWVYKPIQDVIKILTGNTISHLEYTGKDFNKVVRQLVKKAVGELKKAGKQLNETPKAVVVFEDPEQNNINFVYTNYRNTKANENKLSKVFDWNTAVIGINTKGPNTTPIYSQPKRPKEFNIVCYGMGRRGSTWKGGRIVLTE